MTHRFSATIERSGDMDAAYVRVPIDIKRVYGKGRLKVQAVFSPQGCGLQNDGEPYSGSVVNMGVKNADGNVCYVIGIPKTIRQKIGKSFGDSVEVMLIPQ